MIINPKVYVCRCFLWILDMFLSWAIAGKSIPVNSTTDLSKHAWTQSTGQLGHDGGNNKWHKQTLCWDQTAIMRECFHTGHRTWSRLPLPLTLDVSRLSLIIFFLRVSNPAKETWQVLSGLSPKRAISDVTTGRLSAIQPLSQSYHTRPAGMQNPGPTGG